MTLSDSWIDFLAGWCSGAAAVLACQPVDTILTRWQASTTQPAALVGSSCGGSVASQARTFTAASGVAALWRGSSPMITAVPLQNSLLMGGYGVGTRYVEMYYSKHHREARLTAIFIGGCTGGVLQSFLMSPVELIKVSQQCAGQSAVAAGKDVLQGLLHASASAWRGLGATLLRDGIPHGVWFVSYEVAKDNLTTRDEFGSLEENSVAVPLVSGAIAATVAWAVGYPADLIKTRIQAGGGELGILGTAQQIIEEANGRWTGLYRGFGLKLVRSIPASMIGFSVYEFVKKQIETSRL